MNIYVGNLSYRIKEEELTNIFGKYGEVSSVNIIKDRYSGQSKGFGFVEMPAQSEAEKAIKELNGSLLKGRNIKVNKARQRSDRSSRKPRQYYQ